MVGEEVTAVRVPPLPAKLTQEQDEHYTTKTMQPIVHGATLCQKSRHASPHEVVKESCQKLESTTLALGQVHVQTHWVSGCDTSTRGGHECP